MVITDVLNRDTHRKECSADSDLNIELGSSMLPLYILLIPRFVSSVYVYEQTVIVIVTMAALSIPIQ